MTSARILGLSLAVALLGACNEDGSSRARPVSITVFKATPSTIASGATTTIEWASDRATSCTGSGTLPGWAGPKDPSGSVPLTVSNPGTYQATLDCEGEAGSTDSETISVTVNGFAVTIDSFSATPATLMQGDVTTLDWSVSNATACTAEGDLPGWSGAKAEAGSEMLTMATVGSFQATLSCSDADGGTDTATVAVTVTELPPVVTIDLFSAEPSEFVAGASTLLTWSSSAATACTAQGDLPGWSGDVALAGTQFVTVTSEGTYTADLVCDNGTSNASASITVTVTLPTRHRYSMANQCFALKSASTGQYVVVNGSGYAATGATVDEAEPFYMKPSALGDYLLYNSGQQLVTAGLSAPSGPEEPAGAPCEPPSTTLCNVTLDGAMDASVFEVRGAGDATEYPTPPPYDRFDPDTTPGIITAYKAFVDPHAPYSHFTLASKPDGRLLTAAEDGTLSLAAANDPLEETQQFIFEEGLQACAPFPEAESNFTGNAYKGTTSDGRVVGWADTHNHVTATTFLGGAHAGAPFHKFGVTYALADCQTTHGPQGSNDFLKAAYKGDFDGHATAGYPDFTEWPAAEAITDEALYWKWLERAWLGGMRILVNDLVDNGTLCELQRNALDPNDPRSTSEDCNEMKTAREQASTTYAMQDYIDAQYGGRGAGFWQVVWSPDEARAVIEDGKVAVVMGIELTNMFDCQMTFSPNPARKEPFEEPVDAGPQDGENFYKCTQESVAADVDEFMAMGLRQMISIHEFDIAFGGNGIFQGDFLNLGTRENSGGNPTPGVPPNNPFDPPEPPEEETPTGEFWTTYTCPTKTELQALDPDDGFLWNSGETIGEVLTNFGPPPPLCVPGQGGRNGGAQACYPPEPQCNARWMTPMGLYLYKLAMTKGLIVDFDHFTIDMKTQLLDLFEAQDPPYPIVSTHGTFGGTTYNQARRVLASGGHLYPSVGSSDGLVRDIIETRQLWEDVASSPHRIDVFGFGFGTDTDGLSDQAGPGSVSSTYPFTFYKGEVFDAIPEFATLDDDGDPSTPYEGVTFSQPQQRDLDGNVTRTWDSSAEGTAHGGMVTDMIDEIRLLAIRSAQDDSVPVADRVQHFRAVFNSAEMYLQTWEKTIAARDAILANDNGGEPKEPVTPVLRQAWGPNNPPPWTQ